MALLGRRTTGEEEAHGLHPSALLGLAAASMGITLLALICEPREPPGIHKDKAKYLLAIWGACAFFFAGVAAVVTAVWLSRNARARRAAGRKVLYASVFGPLALAVGLSVWLRRCCCDAR